MNFNLIVVKSLNDVDPSIISQVEVLEKSEFHTERRKNDRRLPQFRIGRVLAMIENKVVGISEIYYGCAIIFHQVITLGGISGLIVSKKYREKGIGGAIVKRIIEELKSYNFDIVFLYTDPDRDSYLNKFYQNLGFSNLPSKYKYSNRDGESYSEDGGMISPCNNYPIFEKIMNSTDNIIINGGRW